jgi:mono/diheme cytochrome c family protein
MHKKHFFILLLFGCTSAFAQTKQSTGKTGKQLYAQYCLTCHQEDGEGVPNMNPPLTQTSYVLGDKNKLIAWVLQGSGKEKVPIDGKTYGNNMPPQAALKDDEIAKILTYVRSHFDNNASAVTLDEVKTVRASLK